MSPRQTLRGLEIAYGGRLGVVIEDLGSGHSIASRPDERFPMCSTFKFLLSAFVLSRVDRGLEQLDHRIVFSQRDILPHAPLTEPRVGGNGMTIGELCEAAMIESDNTAANLLLARIGGPQAVTAYARSLGDEITRLDRIELALNDVGPGDPRDTTTPAAMLENLRKIVLGDALSPPSRARMTGWLIANRTGDARLRAGVPAGWRIGDKTGSGPDINHAINDIAIIWPPHRAPILVTAYYAFSPSPDARREAVLAKVAQLAVEV